MACCTLLAHIRSAFQFTVLLQCSAVRESWNGRPQFKSWPAVLLVSRHMLARLAKQNHARTQGLCWCCPPSLPRCLMDPAVGFQQCPLHTQARTLVDATPHNLPGQQPGHHRNGNSCCCSAPVADQAGTQPLPPCNLLDTLSSHIHDWHDGHRSCAPLGPNRNRLMHRLLLLLSTNTPHSLPPPAPACTMLLLLS